MTHQERAQVGERIAEFARTLRAESYPVPAALVAIVAGSVYQAADAELLALLQPWCEQKAQEARAELMVRQAEEEEREP